MCCRLDIHSPRRQTYMQTSTHRDTQFYFINVDAKNEILNVIRNIMFVLYNALQNNS